MNMQHVIKVNGVVCPIIRATKKTIFLSMYSRKKQYRPASKVLIENHVNTGRFHKVKVQ